MVSFSQKRKVLGIIALLALVLFTGCLAPVNENKLSSEDKKYIKTYLDFPEKYRVNNNFIEEHIIELSSEKYAGRKAGTPGEKEAALYLARQLKKIGASPYNGMDYFQEFFVRQTVLKEKEGRYYLEPLLETSSVLAADNVLGIFKKDDCHDYIIISANYDNLGSVDGKFFPGANSNASGTAAVLEIARIIGKNFNDLEYNFVIAFWSGNENGMSGSKKYFESLLDKEKEKIKMVINLDTIGSYGESGYIVWRENSNSDIITEKITGWKELTLLVRERDFDNSDHFYFASNDIPAVTILSESWKQETGTLSDDRYGVDIKKVGILSQYLVNYLFSMEGTIDA